MNDSDVNYDELTKKLINLARESPAVRAIFIVDSKTRASAFNDRWSDIDYILFTKDKKSFLDGEEWMRKLGNPLTKIKQLTAGAMSNGPYLLTTGWTRTSCSRRTGSHRFS